MSPDVLKQRLAALESEYEAGQKMLANLDEKRENVKNTLLRIQGAMQLLRELLSQEEGEPAAGGTPPGTEAS